MDDGASIATTLYTPDGAVPVGGRPGVVVLHGLAGTRGSVDALSASFATAGSAVLAYDARGHGASGGEITLAGPREVADLRTIRNAFARSSLSRGGSIRTPMYLSQGRTDFAFDISQATRAFARLAGPKRLYVGNFGHAPSTFPGPDLGFVLSEGRAFFDAHLKGVDSAGTPRAARVTIAARTGKRTSLTSLPGTGRRDFVLPGRTTLSGSASAERRTAPLQTAIGSSGGGTATVTLSKLTRHPRLVVP